MPSFSFSLYGDRNAYTLGMIENCIIAKTLFPSWTIYIYYNESVPIDIIYELASFDNTIMKKIEGDALQASNTMWRFLPMFELDDIIVSRDADSRLNERDVDIITKWMNTDHDFYISRDSPSHTHCVMAGAFGVRNGILKKFRKEYDIFKSMTNQWYIDQRFLAHVYEKMNKNDIVSYSVRCNRDNARGFHNENRVKYPRDPDNNCIGSICFKLVTKEMVSRYGDISLNRIDNPRKREY